ncbi:hypothetical protein GBA52_009242 [Prunus armeniaca]|nr:hypothetical protein GBA52_009242 [Prunus armeniaca]
MFNIEYQTKRRRDAQVSKIDDFPQEILFEIFTRLSVKSLLRSRCVCKSWKSLIRNPDFMNAHLKRNVLKNACDCLVIHTGYDVSGFSVYDAEEFTKRFDLELPRPKHVSYAVYGSCNGVLCISATWRVNLASPIYLLNPSIRVFKKLPDCHILQTAHFVTLGFGFHERGDDYKVVRVVRFPRKKDFFAVEVYSLRLDTWRRITATPPVSQQARFPQPKCLFFNGFLYWITVEPSQHCTSIVSFDLDSEVFQKITLPDMLFGVASVPTVQVFEESLSLFHQRKDDNVWYCDIWVVEADTWTMNRTIRLPRCESVAWPLGIRTDNKFHLVRHVRNMQRDPILVLCDPVLRRAKDTGISLSYHSQFVDAYRESLILLN